MSFTMPRKDIPSQVCIITFPKEEFKNVAEIIHHVKSKLHQLCTETQAGFKLTLDLTEGYMEGFEKEESFILVISLYPKEEARVLKSLLKKEYELQMEKLKALIPKNSLSMFTLYIGLSKSLKDAQMLLKEYLNRTKRSVRSMGIVHGSLLATLDIDLVLTPPLKRDFIVIPFNCDSEEGAEIIQKIFNDLAYLASYAGKVNQLRLNYDVILRQIDASERNTQIKINEVFATMRRPLEEMGPEVLEEVLRETTTLFSSLSILVSAMKRDYIKAQSISRHIASLFKT